MNNKRKNRGAPVRTQPQQRRSVTADGVYNNAHFMHAAAAQVGSEVRIKTASGKIWEGVFRTFSSDFEVVLEVAYRVDNPDCPNGTLKPEVVYEKIIFKQADIVMMTARDVDVEYAMKDGFQTDVAIAQRLNGSVREQKELEPWDASSGINGSELSLELDSNTNGWDAIEMFKKNEEDYGITSTYDNSLRGYTVELQETDSADYRKAKAQAESLAKDIECGVAHKERENLENGDEEDTFASVQRPGQEGKYIPPNRRKGSSQKLVRSTPPPSSHPSSNSSNHTTPSPKGNPPPMNFPSPHPHPNASSHPGSSGGPLSGSSGHLPAPQHQQPMPAPVALNPAIQPEVQQQYIPQQVAQQPIPQVMHQMPPPNHARSIPHNQPHGYNHVQRQNVPGPSNKGPINNGDPKRQGMPLRNNVSYVNSQMMQQPPPPVVYQQQGGQQEQVPMKPHHQDVIHQHPPVPRSQEDTIKNLQAFSQEFKLAQQGTEVQPIPPPSGVPQVMEEQVLTLPLTTMPPPPLPNNKPLRQPSPPQQLRPVQPATPPEDNSIDRVTDTLRNSTLNPNAKEFVMHQPSNRSIARYDQQQYYRTSSRPHTPATSGPQFVQTVGAAQQHYYRSPSTSSRPPTPSTPGTQYVQAAGPTQHVVYMVQPQPQPPQHYQAQQQGTRMRRNDFIEFARHFEARCTRNMDITQRNNPAVSMGQPRQDISVAAATGIPLMQPPTMPPQMMLPQMVRYDPNNPSQHQYHYLNQSTLNQMHAQASYAGHPHQGHQASYAVPPHHPQQFPMMMMQPQPMLPGMQYMQQPPPPQHMPILMPPQSHQPQNHHNPHNHHQPGPPQP